jgi:2-polyprenyl-6-methoxyphenol hydroxylase-like FAD-dependent oxidoreductase
MARKVEAEFVIGADGVRSVIRQALYGDDNPTYTGQMVWRALLNGSDVPEEVMEPMGHTQWVGPGCHLHRLLHPRQEAREHRHPGGHRQMGRGRLVDPRRS